MKAFRLFLVVSNNRNNNLNKYNNIKLVQVISKLYGTDYIDFCNANSMLKSSHYSIDIDPSIPEFNRYIICT